MVLLRQQVSASLISNLHPHLTGAQCCALQPTISAEAPAHLECREYVGCRNCNFNLEGSGPYQLMANLSSEGFLELCSSDCRLAFLRRWIRSHLEECKRIGQAPPDHLYSCANLRPGLERVQWHCGDFCMLFRAYIACMHRLLCRGTESHTSQSCTADDQSRVICELLCFLENEACVMQANHSSLLSLVQGSQSLSATVSTRSCMMS